jgi:hypothetical protein
MTALTLVMGFYEFVRKGQKYDGKSDASTSLGGRLIKAHDKHAPCAVVGLLVNFTPIPYVLPRAVSGGGYFLRNLWLERGIHSALGGMNSALHFVVPHSLSYGEKRFISDR